MYGYINFMVTLVFAVVITVLFICLLVSCGWAAYLALTRKW